MIGETNAVYGGINSSEQINIKLITNLSDHSDLLGAVVTFTYGEETLTFTWDGNEINLSIPVGIECNVSVSSIEGYKTPDEIHFITLPDNVRQVTPIYQTQLLTIEVKADDGSSISGYNVTLSERETVGDTIKFTRLEYIESNGTQFINTGFMPNQDTRLIMDIELTDSLGTCPFGVHDDYNGVGFSVVTASNTTLYSYNNSNISLPSQSVGVRFTMDANKNTMTIGSDSKSLTYSDFQCGYPLYLFASNMGADITDTVWTSAKLYSCKIYNNGVLVRDFIPAMRHDGVAGLYDDANGEFYTSLGTSEFIAPRQYYEVFAQQTASSVTYKIPFGTEVRLDFSDITGFITPTPMIFLAETLYRTITVKYIKGALNVWVATESGKLINPDHWIYTEGETPIGVAIITENSSFIVDGSMFTCQWTDSEYTTQFMQDVPIVSEDDLENDIHEYYDGMAYTNNIIQYSNSWSDFSKWTQLDKLMFGDRELPSYVGSTGEWADLGNNFKRVCETLELIGMQFRYASRIRIHTFWTSCQCEHDATMAYAITYYPDLYPELDDYNYWFATPLKGNYDEYEGTCMKPFYKL